MTTALSLIISKVTTSLRKPVVFRTSAVHAKGHTLSASVIGCEMQSQRFQSELGIIQTACSQKLVARVVVISDCSCMSSRYSATAVSNYCSSASIVTVLFIIIWSNECRLLVEWSGCSAACLYLLPFSKVLHLYSSVFSLLLPS